MNILDDHAKLQISEYIKKQDQKNEKLKIIRRVECEDMVRKIRDFVLSYPKLGKTIRVSGNTDCTAFEATKNEINECKNACFVDNNCGDFSSEFEVKTKVLNGKFAFVMKRYWDTSPY